MDRIPGNLFKNNVVVKSFDKTFGACYKLKEIPSDLFQNNHSVESFCCTFSDCYDLIEIPSGLFKYNVYVKHFDYTFDGCERLTFVPDDLFSNNIRVKSFRGTFDRTKLQKGVRTGDFFDEKVATESFMDIVERLRKIVTEYYSTNPDDRITIDESDLI